MSKHKSTDYKLTAVKYYLEGKSSLDNVCKIFNCSPKSLYLKHHLKLNKKLLKYDELNKAIKKVIGKIKTSQYANYFNYAYNKDAFKHIIIKQSTLKRKLKNYKE